MSQLLFGNSAFVYQHETEFALRLLATLLHSGSVVLSPLSISLGLALIHAGTQGSTKRELEKVLLGSDGHNASEILEHFAHIMDNVLEGENGVETSIVNRVFVNKQFTIQANYLASVEKFCKASVQNLDFSQKELAAETINNFVEDSTRGKIKNLIPTENVENMLSFLVNAVSFRADWQSKFNKASTAIRNFYTEDGVSRQILFLNEFEQHRDYTEDGLFQVLSLKYADPNFSLTIFLPKRKFGLIAALEKTTGDIIQNLLNDLKNSYVNVHIPKFQIEKELDLKTALEAIGIKEIFQEGADISGIAENLKISSAIHKAIIEVDEDGTTASAASAFNVTSEMMIMAEPTTFLADHPFFFTLFYRMDPLFVGVHS